LARLPVDVRRGALALTGSKECHFMSDATTVLPQADADLAAMTIRDLIAIEPRALEILAPYGIDLCCGGGHPLGEALDLHGVEREPVFARLAGLAAGKRG
jgi:hypothetical protein